jgi:hypothetical protein
LGDVFGPAGEASVDESPLKIDGKKAAPASPAAPLLIKVLRLLFASKLSLPIFFLLFYDRFKTPQRRCSLASGGTADVSRAKPLKKFDQNFFLPLGQTPHCDIRYYRRTRKKNQTKPGKNT